MRVAEDVVDADILVNNGGTSISRAPRDTAFCKFLYKFSDSFAHDLAGPTNPLRAFRPATAASARGLPMIVSVCMIFSHHR